MARKTKQKVWKAGELVWFSGAPEAGILSMGPFTSQVDAWKSLVLDENHQKWQRLIHAKSGYVWCETLSADNPLVTGAGKKK